MVAGSPGVVVGGSVVGIGTVVGGGGSVEVVVWPGIVVGGSVVGTVVLGIVVVVSRGIVVVVVVVVVVEVVVVGRTRGTTLKGKMPETVSRFCP